MTAFNRLRFLSRPQPETDEPLMLRPEGLQGHHEATPPPPAVPVFTAPRRRTLARKGQPS